MKLNNKNQRISSLDWLRGIVAMSIMSYHLTNWHITKLDSSSLLGRLGIYGVSIFFILSGLSIALAYEKRMSDVKSAVYFFIRRIFRIWPLFFMTLIFYILFFARSENYGWKMILLNATLLFSFVRPHQYIITGGWAIGNEIVYYSLTPFILTAYNKNRRKGNLFFTVCIMVGLLFSFFLMDSNKSLATQWSTYVNPFNNLFLYVAGVAIYYNLKKTKLSTNLTFIGLGLCILLLAFLPYTNDAIGIVTGFARMIFSSLSIFIVVFFYKLIVHLPKVVETVLVTLGDTAYGIYLLHPVVDYSYTRFLAGKNPVGIGDILIIEATTIAISIASYVFLEKRLMQLGKTIILKIDILINDHK